MTELIVDPHDGESSEFGAEMEMVRDIAAAIAPMLRAKFSHVGIAIRVPPQVKATALVVQIGDMRHEATIEQRAEMTKVMDAIRVAAKRLYPTIPLELEILRPPVAPRWGFVAHVKPDPHGKGRIYPRIVKARAITRPPRRTAIALLEGKG